MVGIRRKNIRWVDIDMAEVKLEKLVIHFAQSNKSEGKSSRTIFWYSEIIGVNDITPNIERYYENQA